jgi:hypothetical protein
MVAGTMSILTTVASRSTATANPTPNILITGSSPSTKLPNTLIMMSAAAVMTRAELVRPESTLPRASPVRT